MIDQIKWGSLFVKQENYNIQVFVFSKFGDPSMFLIGATSAFSPCAKGDNESRQDAQTFVDYIRSRMTKHLQKRGDKDIPQNREVIFDRYSFLGEQGEQGKNKNDMNEIFKVLFHLDREKLVNKAKSNRKSEVALATVDLKLNQQSPEELRDEVAKRADLTSELKPSGLMDDAPPTRPQQAKN